MDDEIPSGSNRDDRRHPLQNHPDRARWVGGRARLKRPRSYNGGMRSINKTAVHIGVLLMRPWSLTARVYSAILVVALAVALYFSYSWYAQKRLAGITHDILDKRIVIIHLADRIKETMLSDQATLLHYAATRGPADLREFQGLGWATVREIDILRHATTNPQVIQKLDPLQAEVQNYFAEAGKLVGIVD